MSKLYSLDQISEKINKAINSISYKSHNPQSLFEPISYILSLGGKRVRPSLSLMAHNIYSDNVSKAMPIALGIEIFHNFTLLHDDLMDKADVRRGKPTVHIKWSDNAAILSGDAMLIEAYKEIVKVEEKYLVRVLDSFSQTAVEICCGQQLDMEFEQRMDVSKEEYIEMIRLKTAVLLACALQLGAITAGASEKDAENLYQYGINIGLAFQLKDDLLDVYGNPETFGKRIGGDILSNKKTFILISALSSKDKKKELMTWIEKEEYDEQEKIDAVTKIYDSLGLKEESEKLIQDYYKKAIDSLKKLDVDEKKKKELYELSENLMFRKS